jgi:hypothetical protein
VRIRGRNVKPFTGVPGDTVTFALCNVLNRTWSMAGTCIGVSDVFCSAAVHRILHRAHICCLARSSTPARVPRGGL